MLSKETLPPLSPIDICMLAGKIMLQSGAETYRVEDTMIRIAQAVGLSSSHSYVTPTGIIFQAGGPEAAKLIRIAERTTDLEKVASVNSISRKLVSGEIGAEEASDLLRQIDSSSHAYPVGLQIAAASIASGCFAIMFGGQARDFIPALVSGGLGYTAVLFFHRLIKVKFFAEFTTSLLIGLVSYLFIYLHIGLELDKIIIGSVMPLVPGLLITNAVRDLMAGHLVSGLSRGAEAMLTAFAIGAGVAAVFTFL
ncbi:threonine/serine exporter family protein [Paenibacillus pinistramenti]|uniref:threonine/serine exporter family protein n=1 Tax=Paenibacillus pinistramenti TaxID=1768003 RepID=UPI00110888B5|nr:threonine/serine exporter family protein [Paenibacillus pinistramenti]